MLWFLVRRFRVFIFLFDKWIFIRFISGGRKDGDTSLGLGLVYSEFLEVTSGSY